MKYLKIVFEAFVANRARQAQSYINSQRLYY
jgi:hypothetical protein